MQYVLCGEIVWCVSGSGLNHCAIRRLNSLVHPNYAAASRRKKATSGRIIEDFSYKIRPANCRPPKRLPRRPEVHPIAGMVNPTVRTMSRMTTNAD
jgi:hypothetical protein